MNAKALSLLCVAASAVAGPSLSHAAVLFSSNAESGTCNTAVPTDIHNGWDSTGSGDYPNSRMFYRCDTPVPNSGRTKYFRIDAVAGQHDSWNQHYGNTITLTAGSTYYYGTFFRFDRIGGVDIWHDTNEPDSFDKLVEFRGSLRWLVLVGWPNSNYQGVDHKFVFDLGVSPTFCSNCGVGNEKWANVAPYGKSNPFLADYGKWYAVVMAITPSSGGDATNGKVELFINGIMTTSLAPQKTQNANSIFIESFQHSGTAAQPAYDAPAHYRKYDQFMFTNSLADIQNAGLMREPEAGGSPVTPPPPGGLTATPSAN